MTAVSDVKPPRKSDKRTNSGRRRFVRDLGIHNRSVLLAECGCEGIVIAVDGVCLTCGGARLTREERKR
jgi:hypothetical protein